mgnify:CR=1 FL=1
MGAVLTALFLCISLTCLFGCGNLIEGKYFLSGAGAQDGGALVSIMLKDEQVLYANVNNGVFIPENYRVEIKGKTLMVHDAISPVVGVNIVKFNLNGVRDIKNFTLKTSSGNKNRYTINDLNGATG